MGEFRKELVEPEEAWLEELKGWLSSLRKDGFTYREIAKLLHSQECSCSSRLIWKILNKGWVPKRRCFWDTFFKLRHGLSHLKVLPPRVYAVHSLPPGTVILGEPKVCPVCHRVYIFPYAFQKYCSDECRRIARNERRRRRRREKRNSGTGG